MVSHRKALTAVHAAVVLFAFAGLFAKWLVLPALVITCGRSLFAAAALVCYAKMNRQSLILTSGRNVYWRLLFTGIILAAHWWCFFASIQLSSVAIGLLTFAAFPLFTALLEPFVAKTTLQRSAIAQSLTILLGLWVMLPPIDWQNELFVGAVVGLLSALLFSVLTLSNRLLVSEQKATAIAFYQNLTAGLLLAPAVLWLAVDVSFDQLALLFLLGVVFTAVAHSLFNFSLKGISAHTASVAVSLEPVYGILAAILLLNEQLTWPVVVGGGLILLANGWNFVLTRRTQQKSTQPQ